MKPAAFKRIIWAVDAMEPVEFQENAESVLRGIAGVTEAEVYPVYVFNQMRETTASSLFEEACMALSEKRLKQLAENSDIKNLNAGEILLNDSYSGRAAVKTLVEFAEEKKAEVIVVSTHSRGAVEKFFLGSFAETLLMQSGIPVITVNPDASVGETISRVLLPSAFDLNFRPAFENTLKLCAALDASLTVFYKEPFIPLIEISYDLVNLLESEAQQRKKEAVWYSELAEKYRVPLEVCFDSKPGKVADAIVDFSGENKFDLIVMPSDPSPSGPGAGGVCRKVVRRSETPVLSFRTPTHESKR